ncbi:Crp/Fnr family transcriptional regulator [Brevundimonas sp. Root1279]|uniref:Crp/Fnr family transcriptional regulator n=1 Tax=Brevundimonas sp. Root1279 TaxID=1736443 RepID=UPI0006FAD5F5|nr:Crp/Fnr family transcriptional regulator [Brevundimonas sp. Root1279]KQW80772.1 hypothetical protein ASC65_12410 [Brevundimonas sp. Root1279]
MDGADLEALTPALAPIAFERGVVVIKQGEVVEHLIFPTTAFLANTLVFPTGGSSLIHVIGAEGVAGLGPFLADEPSGWTVAVRAAGEAYRLPAAALERQMERSPILRSQLQKLYYDYQLQAAYGVGCAAHHHSRGRVASLLLRATDRLTTRCLHVTQQDLADMLGIQRTTVVDAARHLKSLGAVHYTRGAIEVADRQMLEREACECYAALSATPVHGLASGSARAAARLRHRVENHVPPAST